jgi:hypothetical protein
MGHRTAVIADPRAAAALAMYEREIESHIAKAVRDINKFPRLRILHHHTHRSQFSSKGVPDDTFVNPRLVGVDATMYFECKRECRCAPDRVQCEFHPSAEQQEWMDALEHAGHAVYLIRPSDILTGRAGRIITEFARARR